MWNFKEKTPRSIWIAPVWPWYWLQVWRLSETKRSPTNTLSITLPLSHPPHCKSSEMPSDAASISICLFWFAELLKTLREKPKKTKKTMFVLAKIGLEQKGRMKASHRLCSCNFSATAVILYSSRVFQKWQWLLLSYSRMLQFPAVTIIRSRGKRWQEFTCAWGCTQILE